MKYSARQQNQALGTVNLLFRYAYSVIGHFDPRALEPAQKGKVENAKAGP